MARLPGTSWVVGEGRADPGKCQVSPGPKPRAGGGGGSVTGGGRRALGRGLRPQTGPAPPPQDWDYTYVHSSYHCALAMSFTLLLPKVNKKAGSAGAPAKLDCSTLCCACI